jgi:VWFA-related protein
MIRPILLLALCCAAGSAQLPPPQSAPPPPEPDRHNRKTVSAEPEVLHVDARVTDFQGRPANGLTAADFTIEADGKPMPVSGCRFVVPSPVRVALVIDDLSLSLQHLADVKFALQKFIDESPSGHEFAIVRTSGSEGVIEQFTSDRTILSAAIAEATDHPLQSDSTAQPFQVGTLGTLQAVFEGLRQFPGRKAVLLLSERLRDPRRGRGPREAGLPAAANRASAVFYAFDAIASNEQAVMLEQGLIALAADTGGKIFPRGVDAAEAIAQVLRDQSGYYQLSFSAEGLPYDFVAAMPRIERLAVKAANGLLVRARTGPMGGTSDPDAPHVSPGTELGSALTGGFAGMGIRTRLTPLASLASPSTLDAVVHIDAHDLVLTKMLDEFYHADLDISAEIFGNTSMGVQHANTGVRIQLARATLTEILERGFDCKVRLNVPRPGLYQLRVAVADQHSARIGSASAMVRIPEWDKGKLVISSIILRDSTAKAAPDSGALKYLDEDAPPRVFAPGNRIPYTYYLHNLTRSPEKHAQIEIRSQLLRDGVAVYASDAKQVDIDLSSPTATASAGGTIALTAETPPGHYVMLLTVGDMLANGPPRVTQTVDFQVRR